MYIACFHAKKLMLVHDDDGDDDDDDDDGDDDDGDYVHSNPQNLVELGWKNVHH